MLHLVAREGVVSGPAVVDDDPSYDPTDTSVTKPFSSARLRTKGKFDFRYGRVEIRAKPAAGQGMWPALWMLPSTWEYGPWPASGEIDIMEHVNLGTGGPDDNQLHGTLHYGMPWPQWSSWGGSTPLQNPQDDFQTYALEWEAGELRWFVNGKHYQTQTSEGWYNYVWGGQEGGFAPAPGHAPFDQDFHIILNLAVGGDWPGEPDRGWEAPREMLVDYVRVYECAENPESGVGCAGSVDPVDESLAVNLDAGAPVTESTLLFENGPATLSFDVDGREVNNTLDLGTYNPNGEVTQAMAEVGGEHGQVWEINFNGTGNVFLMSGDMSEEAGVDNGLSLNGGSGWSINGELKFDLFVVERDQAAGLSVKMDSVYPNQGSVDIELPDAGQWVPVSVRIADILSNPLPGGAGLDLANVQNSIVFEPAGGSGNLHFYVDNVRLKCAYNATAKDWQLDKTCSLGPRLRNEVPEDEGGVLTVYEDSVTHWDIGISNEAIGIAEVDEAGRGKVVEFQWNTDEGVAFFQQTGAMDLSDWAGGTLEFDFRAVQESTAGGNSWVFKVDCGHPCGSGDQVLGSSLGTQAPTLGQWQSYSVAIDDLVAAGLDLTNVDTPLVIFPGWGNQAGAILQVDNIRLVKPAI